MDIPPLPFVWDGDAMIPRYPKVADRHYVIGDEYRLGIEEERSQASHNHFFVELSNLYRNLPEDLVGEYPSFEHFRKKLLIKAGYADERSIVCASKAEAQRFAAFIKPMDSYAIIIARECVVRIYTAQSQKRRAMGKRVFQESKDAVLRLASEIVGVTVEQVRENIRTAA